MRHLETEIAVIGAGIVGMAAALELADRGMVVHVLDRAPVPGAEASGAAAGMLAPQHEADGPGAFLDLCLAARDLWLETAPRLHRESGVDPGHRADGFLHVALDGPEWGRFQARASWQDGAGLPVQVLTAGEACGRFPMLTTDLAGALFYAGDHHVHTTHAVEAYAGACRKAGVQFLFGEEVRDLLMENGPSGTRVAGVHTDAVHVTATHTLLAAGAWTGRLAAALGAPLPIEPVRGQIALVRGLQDEQPPCLVGGTGGYLVPRAGGELLAGATSEPVGFDRTTTPRGIEAVWRNARRLIPALSRRRPNEEWAGLRPGTPDALPLLGPLPGIDGLWVDAGHFRNGILLAPLTGRIMARWITEGDPGIDPTPFLPARFLF